MTREEARRLRGDDPQKPEENGPDPAEDPIVYLRDGREPEDEG